MNKASGTYLPATSPSACSGGNQDSETRRDSKASHATKALSNTICQLPVPTSRSKVVSIKFEVCPDGAQDASSSSPQAYGCLQRHDLAVQLLELIRLGLRSDDDAPSCRSITLSDRNRSRMQSAEVHRGHNMFTVCNLYTVLHLVASFSPRKIEMVVSTVGSSISDELEAPLESRVFAGPGGSAVLLTSGSRSNLNAEYVVDLCLHLAAPFSYRPLASAGLSSALSRLSCVSVAAT